MARRGADSSQKGGAAAGGARAAGGSAAAAGSVAAPAAASAAVPAPVPNTSAPTPAGPRGQPPPALRRICIATPSYGSTFAGEYVRSLFRLLAVAPSRNVAFAFNDMDYADIVMSRNYLLSNFYFNHKQASHLLFLDDDMGFPDSLIFDMIDSGEPLLGVVYPKRAIDLQKLHSLSGESFDAALAKATEFIGAPNSFRTGQRFVEVERVGTGVMLISRACIDTMIEKCPDIVDTKRFKRFPFAEKFQSFLTPFDKIKLDDREYSEDFSFCYRWKELCGGKVLASVTDEVTHVGQITVRSKFYNRFAEQIAAKTAEMKAAAEAAQAAGPGAAAAAAMTNAAGGEMPALQGQRQAVSGQAPEPAGARPPSALAPSAPNAAPAPVAAGAVASRAVAASVPGPMPQAPIANLPGSWNAEAQAIWQEGRRVEAIQFLTRLVNQAGGRFDRPLGMQIGYYLAMLNDWRSAITVMRELARAHPGDYEIKLNLAICTSRSDAFREAVPLLEELSRERESDPAVWDSLASTLNRVGELDRARRAGERSLALKDAGALAPAEIEAFRGRLRKPPPVPAGARNVIAFTLFGDNPRYLRGALQNVLRAPEIYPGWQCRFYVDGSVPSEFVQTLRERGAEVIDWPHPMNANGRYRLARRFWVANDPSVHRFMVRDCDSVINAREAAAVGEWLASGRAFHVIRDWWTHTDLMLAGMWGGISGLLPGLESLFEAYRARAVETPNWDQWFLRDCVWAYVRESCLVHDRLFRVSGSVPLPGPVPRGNRHVGQDEYAVRRDEQEKDLADWIERLPCLIDPRTPSRRAGGRGA